MAFHYSPKAVTDGLVIALDAANPKSYPGSGTTYNNLVSTTSATLQSATYNSNYKGVIEVSGTQYISLTNVPTGNEFTIQLWCGIFNANTDFSVTGHRTYAATDNFRLQWDDKADDIAYAPFVDFVSPGGSLTGFTNKSEDDLFETFHQITMASDGTNVKLWYDDEEGSSSTTSRNFSTNGNLRIGIDGISGIGGTDPFNRDGGDCYFSSILIYDRGLTDNEILQNYYSLKTRFGL